MAIANSEKKTRECCDENWVCFHDNIGGERECPRPFLLFDPKDGKLIIADDYEVSNDLTARDFGLSQDDALKLAHALQHYAENGTPSKKLSVDGYDIEQALKTYGWVPSRTFVEN